MNNRTSMNSMPYKLTANPHLSTGEIVNVEEIKKHICDSLELEESEREAFMRNQIWKRVCVHGGGTGGNYLKYTPLLTQASAIYFKLLSVYRIKEEFKMLEIFNKLTQSEQFRKYYRAIKYYFDKKYKFIKD
jgi:hypothetical protein